jgi:hypothetical protein
LRRAFIHARAFDGVAVVERHTRRSGGFSPAVTTTRGPFDLSEQCPDAALGRACRGYGRVRRARGWSHLWSRASPVRGRVPVWVVGAGGGGGNESPAEAGLVNSSYR